MGHMIKKILKSCNQIATDVLLYEGELPRGLAGSPLLKNCVIYSNYYPASRVTGRGGIFLFPIFLGRLKVTLLAGYEIIHPNLECNKSNGEVERRVQERGNESSGCKNGCFLMLWKLLLVSYCARCAHICSVSFQSFALRHLVIAPFATPRNYTCSQNMTNI